MRIEVSSLVMSDACAGLTLAAQLADCLHTQIEQGNATVERPGGTNYLLPQPVPKETIAAILFYAIAVANGGWTNKA
jgi:hypothetical protein